MRLRLTEALKRERRQEASVEKPVRGACYMVWCEDCKAFTIKPDEQSCPKGHVRERFYYPVRVR